MSQGTKAIHITPFPSPRRQRGIATLFIVLMVGLAVSVSVVASIYAVRGAQTQQLTTHTATAAQAAAWRGVEALRRYLVQVDRSVWPTWVGNDVKPVNGLTPLGVSAASLTFVNKVPGSTDHYQVGARVTGTAGIGDAVTTSTVEVVYDIAPDATGAPGMCHSLPRAPMVFNGDVHYTGGSFDVNDSQNVYEYKNIIVGRNLTIDGGSAAHISGCVKGDATISGGGITDNGHLYSEGTITIGGLKFPASTALWGLNVIFNGGSGGPPNKVFAGGFQTNVISGGNKIGTAIVGGTIAKPENSTIPWATGIVKPTGPGDLIITLNDGRQFVLDIAQLKYDEKSGSVSGAAGAAAQIAGSANGSLPDVLIFAATRIAGGQVTMGQGAGLNISGRLWGHDVNLNSSGASDKDGSGNIVPPRYEEVWANGTLRANISTISSLLGGGDLLAYAAGCSSDGTCWNAPAIGSGQIAGSIKLGSAGTAVPTGAKLLPGVKQQQAGTTPGLPGIPWCDARVNAVEADAFREAANYVFEFTTSGKPQVTIQHVKRADGTSADGSYLLSDPASAATLNQLFSCPPGVGAACISADIAQGWSLPLLTKLTPGVFWFDRAVTLSASPRSPLIATLVAKGQITLNDASGDGSATPTSSRLIAPNFAVPASTVCSAALTPSNLCAGPNAFATWLEQNPDGTTTTHTGLPIGNTAIVTERGLAATYWQIQGNVVLGKELSTSGNQFEVTGSVVVGSNDDRNGEITQTTIGATGIKVDVPSNGDLNQLPTCSPGTSPTTGTLGAAVMWSRYL